MTPETCNGKNSNFVTHHAGCECHERRHAEEVVGLRERLERADQLLAIATVFEPDVYVGVSVIRLDPGECDPGRPWMVERIDPKTEEATYLSAEDGEWSTAFVDDDGFRTADAAFEALAAAQVKEQSNG